MMKITLAFTDRESETYISEFAPRFSENFVCIAPFETKSDVFFNVASIRKIICEKHEGES